MSKWTMVILFSSLISPQIMGMQQKQESVLKHEDTLLHLLDECAAQRKEKNKRDTKSAEADNVIGCMRVFSTMSQQEFQNFADIILSVLFKKDDNN